MRVSHTQFCFSFWKSGVTSLNPWSLLPSFTFLLPGRNPPFQVSSYLYSYFYIYILSVRLPHLSPSRGTTAPCSFLAYLRSSHTCYTLQVTSQSNTLQSEPNSDYAVCYINNTELTAAEGLFQSFLKQMLLGSVESLESGEDTHQMLQEMAELHLDVTSCFHP